MVGYMFKYTCASIYVFVYIYILSLNKNNVLACVCADQPKSRFMYRSPSSPVAFWSPGGGLGRAVHGVQQRGHGNEARGDWRDPMITGLGRTARSQRSQNPHFGV